MGFYPDLRKLIKVVPPADRRQTMLFSATLNAWVKNLAWEYTKAPVEIEIEPETVTVEEIDQVLYHVHSDDKMRFLLGLLEREQPESAIIFCNTKKYTEIVARRLEINGIDCEFIMGDLPQVKRLKIIEDVKAGKTRFLVATDVAARGLDIDDLAMVINYDLPVEAENYVHRIGRTARAGKSGKAVSLASEQDVYELPAIERYIGKKIPSAIADESVLGGDKSAGMRIRTDSYDDRGRDSRGRDTRRDDRRPSASRRREAPSGVPIRRGEGPRHDDDGGARSRRAESGNSRRYDGRGPRAGSQGGSGRDERSPDLASLSQEERLAYYKRKYEGQNAGRDSDGSSAEATGRSPERQGGRRRGQSREGGDQRSVDQRSSAQGSSGQKPGGQRSPDQQSGGGRRREGGNPRTGDQRPAQAKQPSRGAQPAAQAAPQAPAKKGLLSKILGIFKKGE
jgi:ATP-dependent RNA helicase RhlB